MSRAPRVDVGNEIYHVINRANGRRALFRTDADYKLFEGILLEAKILFDMRILAYCIMPNHWHLVLYPHQNGGLSKFMQWLTLTHTQRQHAITGTTGHGHLYQGRFKSFLVQKDNYLLQLIRYVERNPIRSKLTKKAQDWKWSSLWRKIYGNINQKKLLDNLPIDLPKDYIDWVNERENLESVVRIRKSINKGTPFGEGRWLDKIIDKFNLRFTTRTAGRPRNGV